MNFGIGSSNQSAFGRHQLQGFGQGLIIFLVATTIAYFANQMMGTIGLIAISAGLLGAVITAVVIAKYPVFVVILWFVTMSGFGTLGMIRMPGIPDFSFPRLFAVVVMLMMPLGALTGRTIFRRPYLPDVLVVIHTFYILWNLQFVGDPSHFHSWYNSSFMPMFAYFFAKQYINEGKQIKMIMMAFVVITAYFSWTSIFEHFGLHQFIWPKDIVNPDVGKTWAGRSRGPFLQPALFGQILGMYLLVHMYFLSKNLKSIWKVLISVNLGFALLGLYYTYTRGGWVSTAVGIIFLSVLQPKIRNMVLIVGVIGVLVALVGLVPSGGDDFLQERIDNTGTIENRLGFLAAATRMIQAQPLFGIGYFNYLDQVHLYNEGTYIPLYGYVKRSMSDQVPIHDIYLGRAAEEGLVSLFVYLGLIGVVAMRFLKRWRLNPTEEWFDRSALATIGALCVCYLVGGMVIDYRYFSLINILFFFFLGVIVGYPLRTESSLAEDT